MSLIHLLLLVVPTRKTKVGAYVGPSLDRAWVRWLTSLLVLAMAANVLAFSKESIYASFANALAGVSALFYFGQLLFVRLAPMHGIRLTIAGSTLGTEVMYLTIPGILTTSYFLALAFWIPALLFYAASATLIQSRLLRIEGYWKFVGLWLLNILGLLALPLLILGTMLVGLHKMPEVIGLSEWAFVYLIAGLIGLVARLALSFSAGAAARRILEPDHKL